MYIYKTTNLIWCHLVFQGPTLINGMIQCSAPEKEHKWKSARSCSLGHTQLYSLEHQDCWRQLLMPEFTYPRRVGCLSGCGESISWWLCLAKTGQYLKKNLRKWAVGVQEQSASDQRIDSAAWSQVKLLAGMNFAPSVNKMELLRVESGL